MGATTFNEAYRRLNPAQKQAVDAIEGPVMVVAGPGTGKTQILTLRIANILLKTQINPENILALTFTESGVLSMRKRLVEIINAEGYKVAVHTFHSFCNEVIKNNPEYFPHLISSENITEIEQIQIIEGIVDKLSLLQIKPFGDPYYYIKPLLATINDLKKDRVSPADLAEALIQQQKDFDVTLDLYHEKGPYKGQMRGKYQELQREILKNQELVKVYQEYQATLLKQKKYDFSDMILEVVEALQKHQNLLMRLQETFQYLLIDEHQDSNFAQNKLVELLCNYFDNPNLFVVGDDKQAIYRFQGASLENFLYFKTLYKDAQLINLQKNYRSSQIILNAASSLIRKNITSEILAKHVELKATKDIKDETVKIAELSNFDAEHYFIAEDIMQKHQQGEDYQEIAILARNNRDLLPLAMVFEQKGIPYNIESDQDIFADPDVQKLILLLRAMCNFGKETDLVKLLHVDFLQIDPLDIYRLLYFAKKEKTDLFSVILSKGLLSQTKIKNPDKFTSLIKKLNLWKKLCHNDSADNVYIKVLKDSGLLDLVLEKPNKYDVLDKFAAVYTEIKLQMEKNSSFDIEGFLKYVELLEEHQVLIKKPARVVAKDAVRLMTAHRSKGLEFNYVYIIHAYDGHWGNSRVRTSGFKLPREYLGLKLKLGLSFDEMEDERRLFYVSLTRARKGVMILYSNRSLDGKEQFQSQFIEEIDDKYKERVDVHDFEQRFFAEQEQLFNLKRVESVKSEDEYFIENRDFFQILFFEQGLSATGLNDYLKCPWRYVYRHLLGLPQERTKHLVFGTAIHKAINKYIALLNGGKSSYKTLLNFFKESLQKESTSKDLFSQLFDKGEQVLPVFYENEVRGWGKGVISEYTIRKAQLTDNISLNGTIDMIRPIGYQNHVAIYDFKTGLPKSRGSIAGLSKASTGDYLRQLIFYALLLSLSVKQKMLVEEGVISFVEPDSKGRYHKESFIIDQAQINELELQIKQVSDDIINLSFWGKKCEDKDCEYCKMQNIMLGKNIGLDE